MGPGSKDIEEEGLRWPRHRVPGPSLIDRLVINIELTDAKPHPQPLNK